MASEHRTDAQIRARLTALIEEQQADRSRLSALIGRNPSYLSRYLRQRQPERLTRADARFLSRYFGIPEVGLDVAPSSTAA
jgi:transposase-like protein